MSTNELSQVTLMSTNEISQVTLMSTNEISQVTLMSTNEISQVIQSVYKQAILGYLKGIFDYAEFQ